jgi:tRNA A37 N6-isopentenylltransferase MiaA
MEHKTWNMEHKRLRREIIQRWKFAEHGYARRQLTWFKKDPRIHWFDITKDNWLRKVEQSVNKWYNQ